MPTFSSLLETGLFPPSPIAEWPPPPLMDCPEATSPISLHHHLQDWLPSRIVYDPTLALTLDANLREAVALAEAAAVLAGRDTDIVDDATAEVVKGFLRRASEKLPSYHENRIQQRLDQVIKAVLPLVKPLHTLFGLPAPPRLAVDGPADIPAVLVKPDVVAGDDLFGRELQLEPDILIREFEKDPRALADHGIWLTMEVKTPEAQRPLGRGTEGGLHRRMQALLGRSPNFTIDQIDPAIPDEDVRSELLEPIVTARICSNEHLFFVDGIKFAVGRLVSNPDDSYSAIISPFHPIVPGRADSCTPSFARVLLATLCPFVIKADQADRALLAESRPLNVTDHAAGASRRQQSASYGRSVPEDAARSLLSGSAPCEAPTFSREGLSGASTFRIIYPDRHAIDAWRFDHSTDADAADSAKPTFRLFWLITKGGGGVVYGGRDPFDEQIVLKVALPDVEWALQNEYTVGQHLRGFPADAEAPYLLLKTSKRLMAVSRYAGESPEEWDDLSRDVRIALFVSLVRLHQLAHVQHNDIAPRNVVVDADDAMSARWIDWSLAKLGHDCGGSGCYELRQAAGEMGLYDEGGLAEDVRASLLTGGLRW